MASAFIPDDGYTECGFIAALPGLWDLPLRFQFRPFTQSDRVSYYREADKLKDLALRKRAAEWLAKKVVGWDLHDGKDGRLEATPDNLLRLKPRFFDRLFGIVSGQDPSDPDPDAPDRQPADDEGDQKN